MYRVMVTPTTGSRRRRQATQGERVCTLSSPCEVPANESSVIVGGLDRDTNYSVTVNAMNSENETGPTSPPIAVTIQSKITFLVRYATCKSLLGKFSIPDTLDYSIHLIK